jgi:hypothetical protein
LGEGSRSDPRRPFDVGLVENQGFLQGTKGFLIKRCAGEIHEHQDRAAGLGRYDVRDSSSNVLDLTGGATRAIHQKDLFVLMNYESDAFTHGMVFHGTIFQGQSH